MTTKIRVWVLHILLLAVSAERPKKVLFDRKGVIHSVPHHGLSKRPVDTTWTIIAEVWEPVIISFTQFSVKCGLDWITIGSASEKPVQLCGMQSPGPIELTGGNITITHHFSPLYGKSWFFLAYIKGSAPCSYEEFQCLTGHCIPIDWRCNGQSECLGENSFLGSDEHDCVYAHYDTMEKEHPRRFTPGPSSKMGPTIPVTMTATIASSHTDLRQTQKGHRDDKMSDSHGGTCGGVLHSFYGTFWPPGLMALSQECVWTLDPQDPRPLHLELQMLELGPGDAINITDQRHGTGQVIKMITCTSNYKTVKVESHTGVLSLLYHTLPASEGRGFNATYRVEGYCLPWEGVCGGPEGGCYTQQQRCDGHWDCVSTGRDEEACWGCPRAHFPCGPPRPEHFGGGGGGHVACFVLEDRCNYKLNCADGSDERECSVCQPGTFHCDIERCVVESWRCDGQADCKDGTDEMNCTMTLPRKVITAATVGSLVCGLLLVIAMGCTCKLYSLRTREDSMFAPISRHEAELVQQQAPPSYGQLIAQGIIPPVEDFPTENPNETASLSLRSILQLLRQDNNSSHRRRRHPRFVRRAVRRLRRWGLMRRPAPRSSQPSAVDTSSTAPESTLPNDSELNESNQALMAVSLEGTSQKACLVQGGEPQPHLPFTHSPPTPGVDPLPTLSQEQPENLPLATVPTVTVTVPSSSPSFTSILDAFGLNISLFRNSPDLSCTSLPLSTSSSFASSSSFSSSAFDDEVLLIPLSDESTAGRSLDDDDVPMLT